jgi:hypothetical protein
MQVPKNESLSNDKNFQPQQQITDRAVRQLVERFALTVPVAIVIASLAGLGQEANRWAS